MEQDQGDLTLPGYTCSYSRLTVANCAPAISWGYQRFYTQYPMEASKFWNLVNLFTPESWMWMFGTMFVVVVSLKFATYLGQKLEEKTGTEEIVLLPYRFFNIFRVSSTFKHQSVYLYLSIEYLSPTGAKGVTIYVCLSVAKLKLFIFLAQISKQLSESTQRALRKHSGITQGLLRDHSGITHSLREQS